MTWAHIPPVIPDVDKVSLAFVGEAPGSEEMNQGIPLVGPSGRVFNQLLRTAGLDRDQFLLTNLFDEKLPGNDVTAWTMPLAEARERGCTDLPPIGDAGFLRPERRWHLERLQRELQLLNPTVIVPLGGTALWALTGDPRIMAFRGNVMEATRLVPGVKLVPTFHPAAVMRAWKLFIVVVGDFIKAASEAQRGPLVLMPKRRLLLRPTLSDIASVRHLMESADLLSVDIETGWGQITSVGFAWNQEEGICIPFLDKERTDRNYWATASEEVAAWQHVREVMQSPVPKLGQNFGGYDAAWFLRKQHIAPRNFREDTRLLHHALYPELPKDLAFMGASYTQQGAWKHWGSADKRDN